MDLETVIVVDERLVDVLGAVVRPKRSRNSYVGHEALHHTEDGRCALVSGPVRALEARSAVHEHDDTVRVSQLFLEWSRGVDVHHVDWSRCPGRGVVRSRRADSFCY